VQPPEVLKERGIEPQWPIKAGCFKVRKKCAQKQLTVHENKKIVCDTYVDESNYPLCNNNMIIGKNIMPFLGIRLLFDTAKTHEIKPRFTFNHQKYSEETGLIQRTQKDSRNQKVIQLLSVKKH
jgi:hypothetical protein